MATLVKEVGTVTYTEEIERSNFKVVSGDTLTTFNVSISGTPESHLWMGPLFNMPVTDRMRQPFQESFQDGGYVGTALEYLVTDTTNSIIVIDIDKEEFKVGIDGLHFKVTLPLDPSISGITSGLTTTNLYGAYMKTPLYEKRNTSGPCSTNVLDNLTSEESSTVTTDVNIGLDRQPGINPETNGYYNSGVVWLFCDDIRRPNSDCFYHEWEVSLGGTGCTFNVFDCDGSVYDTVTLPAGTHTLCSVSQPSQANTIPCVIGIDGVVKKDTKCVGPISGTNSWETGFAQDAPYTMKKKFPFNFRTDELNGYYVDQPVGIVDLLGGKITIFNEDLVNALDFSGIVDGDSISGATFDSDLTVEFRDYDLTQGWNMTLIAGKNEFQTSNNPTWDPSKCDGKVYITYIDFYDDQGNLVAKGVTDTPLSKEPGQTLVLNTTLKF